MATLMMLLSRYVMNVASATASRAQRRRSSCGLLYGVNVRRTACALRRTVVKLYGVYFLLWPVQRRPAGPPPRPTTPPCLGEAIIDRALALADREGLDAVSIRRIAQDLGVTPMALYWHVKNKEELLAAMGEES